MTDTRFETTFEDVEDLLAGVDVDEIGDIETLLMFLFDRPVSVEETWDDRRATPALGVIVSGNDGAIGFDYPFPLSIIDLARSCAEAVDELGPYTRDGEESESPDVSAMSDGELVPVLQRALGSLRVFTMLGGGE